MKFLSTFFTISALLIFSNKGQSQALPNKQSLSLRAPSNVKIDGKPLEWDGHFQAYNHSAEIYYTISNDDENLYLTIQATNADIINKIHQGGVTFNIKDKSPRTNSGVSITYPVIQEDLYFRLRRKKDAIDDTAAKAADSLMQHNNALIDKYCKLIKLSGVFKQDTTISIYNTAGIKARGQFDAKKTYTCEFSISLKRLNADMMAATKLVYTVTLNGGKPASFTVLKATPGNESLVAQMVDKANLSSSQQSAPTYFTSEYTLTVK